MCRAGILQRSPVLYVRLLLALALARSLTFSGVGQAIPTHLKIPQRHTQDKGIGGPRPAKPKSPKTLKQRRNQVIGNDRHGRMVFRPESQRERLKMKEVRASPKPLRQQTAPFNLW
jgi:hypothetical protein